MGNEIVVKSGSCLYDGAVRYPVVIVATDFRPGSGDSEDEEEFREDAHGSFFEVRFSWPGQYLSSGGGYHDSLEAAIKIVEAVAKDVRWD